MNVRRHLAAQTKEDPRPPPPWLLLFLSTFVVGLFTTLSDSAREILGDVVRELGWDLANLEIWWKAAVAHPKLLQFIFNSALPSLWSVTVSLNPTFNLSSTFYQLSTHVVLFPYVIITVLYWRYQYVFQNLAVQQQLNWWPYDWVTENLFLHALTSLKEPQLCG